MHKNALFLHKILKKFLGRGTTPFSDPSPYYFAPYFKILDSPLTDCAALLTAIVCLPYNFIRPQFLNTLNNGAVG